MIAARFSVNMLATISSRMKVGTASRVSTMRIRKASTTPPIMPEIAPYRAPMTVLAMATAEAELQRGLAAHHQPAEHVDPVFVGAERVARAPAAVLARPRLTVVWFVR